MDLENNPPDLVKVLQIGRLAKISLYRRLLKNVAEGAPLSSYELRAIRDLGAELESMAKEEKKADSMPDFNRVLRQDLAEQVFRVTPQTISKWVLKEGMPRNQDKTFCIADCVEWFLERLEENSGGNELDEAKQWLTEFRKERALKARMERETMEGKLFPREEVTAAWCNRYANIKRYLLVWSRRLPGRLFGISEREMIEAIDGEVRFLLSMLSRPGEFTELAGEFEKACAEGDSEGSGS